MNKLIKGFIGVMISMAFFSKILLSQEINHILINGQSLAVGGVPVVTTSQPFSNLRLSSPGNATNGTFPVVSGNSLVPLVEDGTESIGSGMSSLLTQLTSGGYVSLVSNSAVGGVGYDSLKKGTNPYNVGIAQVEVAKSLAASAGRAYKVIGVANVHGESDNASNTTAGYLQNLIDWQSDIEADIKAKTGQTASVPLYLTQVSSFGYITPKRDYPTTTLSQYQAWKQNPSKIILVGPKYQFEYADGVHLKNTMYPWLGEYYAKAIRKTLSGTPWVPLSPKTITQSGNKVTVKFNVPAGSLAFDTTNVSAVPNMGFEYYDNDINMPTITAVAITGADTVEITLNKVPQASDRRIRYAYSTSNHSDSGALVANAPKGNLRDSDNTVSRTGKPLYNWCVHFDEAIQGSPTALTGTGTNLALASTITMKSLYSGPVGNVKDGNQNSIVIGYPGTWLDLDLGSAKTIGLVKLFNVNDVEVNKKQLDNVTVMFSLNPFPSDDVKVSKVASGVTSYMRSIPIDSVGEVVGSFNARYIRIQQDPDPNTNNYLRLAEVEVYGSSGSVTNQPPTVALTAPSSGASYTAPASINLSATASGNGGATITKVEFFNGSTLIGTDTTTAYSATWSSVSAGTYSVTAKATDSNGLSTTSAAVSVTVNASGGGNIPPTVSLTSPVNNTSFNAGSDIVMSATASAESGFTIAKVEFYNGTSLLGTDTSSPYSFTWTVVPQGAYSLTAKAYDNRSLVTTSSAVNVTVNASSGGTATNLALNKTATQSSGADTAYKVVDGNTDGNFFNGSVTSTDYLPQSWVMVDLGSVQNIGKINIFNRTDSESDRLSNFKVYVSSVAFTSTVPATTEGQSGVSVFAYPGTAGASVTFDANISGRYIRVQLMGTNYLRIAEIQVMSPTQVPINFALNKVARQVSSWGSNTADKAVDGNTDGNYWNSSVAVTNFASEPFWEVDLGEVKTLQKVVLFNRTDAAGDRLKNFTVIVSSNAITATTLSGAKATSGAKSYSYPGTAGVSVEIATPVSGRYVRIQLGQSDYLQLAEVQVIGLGIPVSGSSVTNLSKLKIARQSSNWGANTADKAVDGNRNGDYWAGSVAVTDTTGEPFWEVDLGSVKTLESVNIFNRTDTAGDRLNNFWIIVSSNPISATSLTQARATSGATSYSVTGPIGASAEIITSTSGRYVRIQLDHSDHLQLAEVEVMGR